jgi:Delta24-sterol reductase
MYHALHQSGHAKRYIIQDVAVPYSVADEFVECIHETFWILSFLALSTTSDWSAQRVSVRFPRREAGPECARDATQFWYLGTWTPLDWMDVNHKLEHKVQELNGRKWLYIRACILYGRGILEHLRSEGI